jgi:integrase
VFGTETGEHRKNFRGAWDATCKAAGVEGLHFHDLRREFASRLLESGATDTGLQKAFERLDEHRRRQAAVVVLGVNARKRSGA